MMVTQAMQLKNLTPRVRTTSPINALVKRTEMTTLAASLFSADNVAGTDSVRASAVALTISSGTPSEASPVSAFAEALENPKRTAVTADPNCKGSDIEFSNNDGRGRSRQLADSRLRWLDVLKISQSLNWKEILKFVPPRLPLDVAEHLLLVNFDCG